MNKSNTGRIIAFFALFILLFLSYAQAAPPAEETEKPPVLLSQGEQRTLKIPGLARFSVGSPAIHALMVNGGLLLIKGVQAGDADIWVWKSDGTTEHRAIEVRKGSAELAYSALERPLSRLMETEVYFTGDGVVLRGTVQTFSEAARIEALLAGTSANKVVNETEIAPSLLHEAKIRVDHWLETSKFKAQLRSEIQDGTLFVVLAQGGVNGPGEKNLIERKVRSLFPLTQLRVDALADANPTVHFKVYLLELKKSHARTLGLSWPASQDGAFRVSPARIDNNLSLDVALQALENDGGARILSKPELVVRAPGEAELFSGGEIPIREQSAYFANVTWKTFGLTLKLSVAQSAGDKVRLEIFTEVRRLDPSLSTSSDNIPGLQANRMKTQVDARYGKPLLLSGLLQHNMRREVKGIPILKDIPILGSLFGSEDYLNERSELVAILVPSTEIPDAPMEQIAHLFPTGDLPPSREIRDPKTEHALKEDPNYPWNVLQ
jgi:Flp pilus assembly secretin CpaC